MQENNQAQLLLAFHKETQAVLNRIYEEDQAAIAQAGKIIQQALVQGHHFYVTGTGHSHMIAEEFYTRAGGLACVEPILPPEFMLHEHPLKSTLIERQTSYADVFFALYPIAAGDVVVIASNSGRNGLIVEIANRCRALGAVVIAITSYSMLREVSSRHPSGKKLGDVADLVLDTFSPDGDACCEITPGGARMGAASSITGMYLVQQLSLSIASAYLAEGIQPPVFMSSNVDGADAKNASLFQRYIDHRI